MPLYLFQTSLFLSWMWVSYPVPHSIELNTSILLPTPCTPGLSNSAKENRKPRLSWVQHSGRQEGVLFPGKTYLRPE